MNGGVQGPLTTLGDFTGLFAGLDDTQAGFTQLVPTSVPEPSSLTLLASSIPSVLGLAWISSTKLTGSGTDGGDGPCVVPLTVPSLLVSMLKSTVPSVSTEL